MWKRTLLAFALFWLASYAIPRSASNTLEGKLRQQVDFILSNTSPVQQLIELARSFEVPMAIEWLQENDDMSSVTPQLHDGTVLQLLEAIVQGSAGHKLFVDQNIVRVFSPPAFNSHFNFLNLRIAEYEVTKRDLLGSEALLRHKINELLYPELYASGWGGGYGGAADNSFWIPHVTFRGRNLTIREILTGIAVSNGNALWVVELTPDELSADHPKWEGIPINKMGHSPLNYRWRFISLEGAVY